MAEKISGLVIFLCVFASMGGFIFGYDTGEISGLTQMPDFQRRFGQLQSDGTYAFSNVREGLIVALLSIGTLCGCLLGAPVGDRLGRKPGLQIGCLFFIVGTVVQVSAVRAWYQVMIGRYIAGLGVGMLSTLVPIYQSEAAPKSIRGTLVSTYQLFITFGILTAYLINYGTSHASDTSTAQWRVTIGIGFLWALILGIGMFFLPESPRFLLNHGEEERCRRTLARLRKCSIDDPTVDVDIKEIERKIEAERAFGPQNWLSCFKGPKAAYRTFLGMGIQALQQLTGANFFFYYGTSIFSATGVQNPFVTSIILGAVNFGCTFLGLYLVERFGRRKPLMIGAAWMFMCFLVFAFVGYYGLDNADGTQNSQAGAAMIVFACLFILAFASTWGCMAWVVVAEMFPARIRAKSIALATASNWTWNFLISFFTPFIIGSIGFRYGFVFAACCFAAVPAVYFFLYETKGLTLEQVDEMYCDPEVKPWTSSTWRPRSGPADRAVFTGEEKVVTDSDHLEHASHGGVNGYDNTPRNVGGRRLSDDHGPQSTLDRVLRGDEQHNPGAWRSREGSGDTMV